MSGRAVVEQVKNGRSHFWLSEVRSDVGVAAVAVRKQFLRVETLRGAITVLVVICDYSLLTHVAAV